MSDLYPEAGAARSHNLDSSARLLVTRSEAASSNRLFFLASLSSPFYLANTRLDWTATGITHSRTQSPSWLAS